METRLKQLALPRILAVLCMAFGISTTASGQAGNSGAPLFVHEVVTTDAPRAPWGKTYGDINGDGLPDIIVGGNQPDRPSLIERVMVKLHIMHPPSPGGSLIWYENPRWTPHLISDEFAVRTDIETGDMDEDGKIDVVLLSNSGIYWLKNGSWEAFRIDPGKYHDLELADLDNDGDLDLVARNQSQSRSKDGDRVFFLIRETATEWKKHSMRIEHGEGLKVADMDSDGYPDVVVNDIWLRNLHDGTGRNPAWHPYHYRQDAECRNVFIDTADFNRDGRTDILLSPSEQAGQYCRIAWYEAPPDPDGTWTEHVVDPAVEAVHHFVAARDVDRDGRIDVLSAEMTQGSDPDEVKMYLNEDNDSWKKVVLSGSGSHSMRAVDIDNDFDIDLFGANWDCPEVDPCRVDLWRNTAAEDKAWARHVIDDERPGQATFVFTGDLDGDGRRDIASGGYWYQQPEQLSDRWERHRLGDHASNVAWLGDFDEDGDTDFLASGWIGYSFEPSYLDRILHRLGLRDSPYEQHGERFVWGENDGHGEFTIHDNIEAAQGDFLQGTAELQMDGRRYIVLSWHDESAAVQALQVPDDPVNMLWSRSVLNEYSQGEQISIADIDRDGDNDIMLGTRWLGNAGNGAWLLKRVIDTDDKPDRNQLADMNGDGRLDVVVGYQAINVTGKLAWYEQPDSLEQSWKEHEISADLHGPMSLGVADINQDSRLDIVAGEHYPAFPEHSRLVWFENQPGKPDTWKPFLIFTGDEHHDGALTVDLDEDSDMDIVSIGWTHGKVIVYENLRQQAKNNR